MQRIGLFSIFFLLLSFSCGEEREKEYVWKTMKVTASAYNSTGAQTDGLPTLAAWSDTLVPGMKAIAVSRDLIPLGLDHNTQVRIEGMDGIFLVKDKMGGRWTNRIDIYMGNNVKKAKEWGIKELKIQYRVKRDGNKTAR